MPGISRVSSTRVEEREGRKKRSIERKGKVRGGEEGIEEKGETGEGGEIEGERDGGRGGEIEGETDGGGVVVRTKNKGEGGEGVRGTKGEGE
jgi:hypothetical protein